MHAFDHGVGCEEQRLASGPGNHRGIVADPGLTVGWLRQATPDALDRGDFAVGT